MHNTIFLKKLYTCLGGLSFILFATITGFGQTTTLSPAAQEAINNGIIATKVPDYLLAIKYFEEARKAAPQSPEVFFNLGLAESKIPGRELRAICWFGLEPRRCCSMPSHAWRRRGLRLRVRRVGR